MTPGTSLEEFRSLRGPFLRAFETAYKQLSNEDLGVADKGQFLREGFEGEVAEFGTFVWFAAKLSERPIGAATFDLSNPDEIYVKQLWIDPDHQVKGLGKALVFSILQQYPDCTRMFAICRKLNPCSVFWPKIGFQPSSYMRTGYSADKYTGFTWENPRQTPSPPDTDLRN